MAVRLHVVFVFQKTGDKYLIVNMAEDGEIVSMVDVLEEDNAREEEANAVLGASDDQNCTYSQVSIS